MNKFYRYAFLTFVLLAWLTSCATGGHTKAPVDQIAVVKDLLADLESQDGSVRKDAILALGHLNAKSDEIVRALIGILKNDSIAENRKEAALVLGLVGTDSTDANQALNDALLQDADDSVRGAAAVSLSMIE